MRYIILSEKFPDFIGLGLKAAKFNVDRRHMDRATIIGAMTYLIPAFQKAGIQPLTQGTFDIFIMKDEIGIKWTAKGKKVMKIRMKKNPKYMEEIIPVFKTAYKKYFMNLKRKR